MRLGHKITIFLLAIIFAFSVAGCGNNNNPIVPDNSGNNNDNDNPIITPLPEPETPNAEWAKLTDKQRTIASLAATDDFGRSIVVCGDENEQKYVGMFFFVWNGFLPQNTIYDVSALTKDCKTEDEVKERFLDDSVIPKNSVVHWGKPIWDYYSQDDEWVIRKQIEMFTMAGIDFLFFDVTNAYSRGGVVSGLFERPIEAVMNIVKEYRDAGWEAPQLMFYTNSNVSSTQGDLSNNDRYVAREIYNHFYTSEKFKDYGDVWFAPNGKPLIVITSGARNAIANSSDATDKAMKDYFQFKNNYWPLGSNTNVDQDSFSWLEKYSIYPNKSNYCVNRGGMVNISIAQHTVTYSMSDMSRNYGRGYLFDEGKNGTIEDARKGTNYQYLWDAMFNSDKDVNMISITGWNEWVAGKNYLNGKWQMCDQFNETFSRDIEPCYNGYGDNFYLQTAMNLRKFKYDSPYQNVSVASQYMYYDDFDEMLWQDLPMQYLDFTGECIERNHHGFVSTTTLTDKSNRNDINKVTVTHDADYLYFRIETAKNITAYADGDNGWMNVMIATAGDSGEGSLFGYRYFINRTVSGNSGGVYKRNSKGEYQKVGDTDFIVKGKIMQMRIPREMLGLGGEGRPSFTFKVCDNITNPEDVLSYYNSGDSAPIGRLGYAYGF